MTGNSSLPPLKKNDGKLGLIALLFLLGAGALWFFLRGGEPEPAAEAEAVPREEPAREQFAAEIELPDDEQIEPAPEVESDSPQRLEKQQGGAAVSNPADWECNGTINAAKVRTVIQGAPSKQVQTCYERGLKGNNLLQGSMEVLLTIGASGAVRAAEVTGTLGDRQVYSCVKRVARTWKFPAPTGGCVRISAPFQMTPKL